MSWSISSTFVNIFFGAISSKWIFLSLQQRLDIAHYGAIRHMFVTLRSAGWHVSVMMLTVKLKKISDTPVWLFVLSKLDSCWLASACTVHYHSTNIAQNTCHCEITMQDFVTYVNSQLSQGQYSRQCVVNIDETNTSFDMESRLTLATKDDKTVSLKTT